MKRILYFAAVVVVLVPALLLGVMLTSNQGLVWLIERGMLELPGELGYQSVDGSLLGPIRLREVTFDDDAVEIRIGEVAIEWQPTGLLAGRLHFESLALSDVDVAIKPASGEPVQFDASQLPQLELPLKLIVDRLDIDTIRWRQDELEQSVRQLQARFESDHATLLIDHLELAAERYHVRAAGRITPKQLYPLDLQLTWRVDLAQGDRLMGQGVMRGDLARLEFEQQLNQPSRISVRGHIEHALQQPVWAASVDWPDYDPAAWQYALPDATGSLGFDARGDLNRVVVDGRAELSHRDTGPLKAQFALAWRDQQLEIEQLRLSRRDDSQSLQASGSWMPGEQYGQVRLELMWENLQWPLQGDPTLISERGQGSLHGGIDSYRFQLQTTRPLDQLPESQWQAKGQGNRDGLEFDALKVLALQGSIDAQGRLDWRDGLAWQVQASGQGLNPAEMLAQWPGVIDVELQHQGQLTPTGWRTQTQVKQAEGELRGFPIWLTSSFGFSEQGWDVDHLQYRSGASVLTASGRVTDSLQIEWKVQSPRLQELLAGLQGKLEAQGELRGSLQQPELQAGFNGSNLAWQGYSAATAQGEIRFVAADTARTQVALQANDLHIAGQSIERLTIDGDASNLRVAMHAAPHRLTLTLVGAVADARWQGKVRELELHTPLGERWQLRHPADLQLGRNALSLSALCADSVDEANLCIDVDWENAQWRFKPVLKSAPAAWLNPYLPAAIKLQSALDANADLRLAGSRLLGSAQATLQPGTLEVLVEDDEAERWEISNGILRAGITDRAIDVSGELRFSDDDRLRTTVSLPGADALNLQSSQPLRGSINAQLKNLQLLSVIIPEIQRVRGEAQVSLQLAGNLGQPAYQGELKLTQGHLAIPRLGVEVNDIEITGDSDRFERFRFALSARSGEGHLRIEGNTAWHNDQWQSDMQITGHNLEVSRIPEASINADLHLNVEIRAYRVTISGTVHIPYAHIEPRDFSTAVRSSSDVVIVDKQQPQPTKWAIVSRIRLTVGDRVHFHGFGIEGRLGGDLLLLDDSGLPTRASGEITIVDGVYRAYGQNLSIEHGRLIFAGGPITNPGLDIRSARQVNTITAGIRVQGSVTAPQVELYSIPAMGQTDILSYLLLGRPLENATDTEGAMMAKAALALGLSGGDRLARRLRERFGLDEMRVESSDNGDQASLVIGRYLSPRLYVSYGIGLIEAFNTLNVRYQLSEQWQLKASSGEAHGADIIYTLER